MYQLQQYTKYTFHSRENLLNRALFLSLLPLRAPKGVMHALKEAKILTC